MKFKNINEENAIFRGGLRIDGASPKRETDSAKLFLFRVASPSKKVMDEEDGEYYHHISISDAEIWAPNSKIHQSRGKLYIDGEFRRDKRIVEMA